MITILNYCKQLCFNGIIFMLFIIGYLFLFFLRTCRLLQKKTAILPVVVILSLAALLLFFYRYHFQPFGTLHTPIELLIAPKTSLRGVASNLKAQRVIRSDKVLIAWMRYKKLERKIQSGIVTVHQGDGVLRVCEELLSAKPIEISVMIPEGLTIEQTAAHILRTIPIDTAVFIALCYDSTFIASTGIEAVTLEGYLYPNTYRLPEKVTSEEILLKMTRKHQAVWDAIAKPPEILNTYSHHQIVTLASIVEREATLFSEQPRIAGVFHNRLRLGYPLGADPTVRFALKKFAGPLRVSELNSNSPYNTRKFAGLPPGPICSPGKGALEAACSPLDTKDMYFVAKWDGSGEHDFSVTNAEHDRKKFEIRNRNTQRLSGKARRAQ